eukprot:GEMP01032971.1.p1 GENE.GEMP01032971.1~~GEMP01032971.1.p1  ORF type:complete len:462 (+),score=95.76 GEMP01032971.1:48-1433(+)
MVLDAIENLSAPCQNSVLDALTQVQEIDAIDRDVFGDFEGIKALCQAAMRFSDDSQLLCAFCKAAAHVCTKSQLNRGIFRSEGGIRILLQFLSQAGSEKEIIACAEAFRAVCVSNDGNKKAAASLRGEFNSDELAETVCLDTSVPLFKIPTELGALDLLLDKLETYDDVGVQESCVWALRVLACDDDTRQATCAPSAVENRDYLANEDHFPRIRKFVRKHVKDPDVSPTLLEGLLFLLKEVGCNQNRIRDLVLYDDVLPKVRECLEKGSESLVRASLFVLRQFAFSDDIKDMLIEQNVHVMVLSALKKYTSNRAIVEQSFGLFANMTMRKPAIAQTLYEEPNRIVPVAQVILDTHQGKPNVIKTVLSTLRNVAKQSEECAQEIRDQEIFNYMRNLVTDMKCIVITSRTSSKDLIDHCGKLDAQKDNVRQWQTVCDICKQFLREFREDTEDIRDAAKYNKYY